MQVVSMVSTPSAESPQTMSRLRGNRGVTGQHALIPRPEVLHGTVSTRITLSGPLQASVCSLHRRWRLALHHISMTRILPGSIRRPSSTM